MTNQQSSTDNQAQENIWHIGPRTLPPPTGDSMEMCTNERPIVPSFQIVK